MSKPNAVKNLQFILDLVKQVLLCREATTLSFLKASEY